MSHPDLPQVPTPVSSIKVFRGPDQGIHSYTEVSFVDECTSGAVIEMTIKEQKIVKKICRLADHVEASKGRKTNSKRALQRLFVQADCQGQPIQGQPTLGQPPHGQSSQGQSIQGQPTLGQSSQGQSMHGQPQLVDASKSIDDFNAHVNSVYSFNAVDFAEWSSAFKRSLGNLEWS